MEEKTLVKHRQSEIKTDRQTDRQKDRQIDSGTKKHYTNNIEMKNKYKHTETNRQREIVIQANSHTDKQSCRQIVIQTNSHTDSHTDRQTCNQQTQGHRNIETD